MSEPVYHVPVLLQEVIDGLSIRPNGVYVDCTFGGGGHSLEMLKLLGREWDSWRTNDQNEVIFDHEDAVKEFETLQGQLTAAARRHEGAEKELLERTAKSRKH